jgi:hypothetical protein
VSGSIHLTNRTKRLVQALGGFLLTNPIQLAVIHQAATPQEIRRAHSHTDEEQRLPDEGYSHKQFFAHFHELTARREEAALQVLQ